jgi:NADPH-dependent 2,4-dienoyl-CoA reductase/sulfur reductase-like enzyme
MMAPPINDAGHPDVLVVGAGPAGLAAAVTARESGAQVVLVDDNPAAGGQIWRGGERAHTESRAARWFARFQGAGIRFLANSQVIAGVAASRTLLVEAPRGSLEIRFRSLILATGSRELFLPFPGWTLPGVMGAGGLQALVESGLPLKGKRVVVAGSGPLLLAVGANLRKAGAEVVLIAEQAPRATVARFALGLLARPSKLAQAAAFRLALAAIPYRHGCWIETAQGAGRLERVRIRQGRRIWTERCDYAAVAYGLYPNTELAALLGCRLDGVAVAVDEQQRSSLHYVYCAGECTGIGGAELSLLEGRIAGYSATGQPDRAKRLFGKRNQARRFASRLNAAFVLRGELRALPQADTLVCRCEDVAFAALKRSSSFRAAKLHTRCGMGPCQGRVCGPATEFLFGWKTDSIRPPLFPVRARSLMPDRSLSEDELTSL